MGGEDSQGDVPKAEGWRLRGARGGASTAAAALGSPLGASPSICVDVELDGPDGSDARKVECTEPPRNRLIAARAAVRRAAVSLCARESVLFTNVRHLDIFTVRVCASFLCFFLKALGLYIGLE